MADKSKRSRVQGGWARPAPVQSTHRRENYKILSGQETSDANSEKQDSKFEFENVVLRKEPIMREISCSVDQIISDEPNGQSRIFVKIGFIDSENCEWIFQQLRDELQWHQHEGRTKESTYLQPRMVAWIGDVPYTYSGVTHPRHTEWSPLLTMLKDTVQTETGRKYNSVLANLYRDGHDHVPWHCDDEPEFGNLPSIASLSFGETRTFGLRRKPFGEHLRSTKDKWKDGDFLEYIQISLDAGTLLLMEGAVQLDWQHRVPREYHDKKPRINLTFRYIDPQQK